MTTVIKNNSPSQAPLKNVVFDFGNVLVRWDPRYLYRGVFQDDDKMEWFLTNICTPEWNAKLDEGGSYAAEVTKLAHKYPEFAQEIKLYDTGWEQMFDGVIEENVELVKVLKNQKIPVYGLTNWSADKFDLGRKLFPFFDWFDGVVVSGRERMKKPEARIFHLLSERYGLNPAETLFIDDNRDNILAAEKLGFVVHHFTSPVLLKNQLRELKVPV